MQGPWTPAVNAVPLYQSVPNNAQLIPYGQHQPQYVFDTRTSQRKNTRRSQRGGQGQNNFIRDEIQKQLVREMGWLHYNALPKSVNSIISSGCYSSKKG